jgi:hypothetical protein
MRTLIFISFFILTILSCEQLDKDKKQIKNEAKWTAEQIRKYFIDSIALRNAYGIYGNGDSLNDFDKFSKHFLKDIKAKNISDPFIFAFDEDYIDTLQIDKNRKWLRIIVNPCFEIPYCIIAEKINDRTRLTIKMTNGYGCYYSGHLNFINSQFTTDTLFENITHKLNTINFWTLSNDTTCEKVLDGEDWTIEAIVNGKYNLLKRHSPTVCSSNETKTLLKIANDLKQLSKLNDFLILKKQIIKKTFGED